MKVGAECPFCEEWVVAQDTAFLFQKVPVVLRFAVLQGYAIHSIFIGGVLRHRCYEKIMSPSEMMKGVS